MLLFFKTLFISRAPLTYLWWNNENRLTKENENKKLFRSLSRKRSIYVDYNFINFSSFACELKIQRACKLQANFFIYLHHQHDDG